MNKPGYSSELASSVHSNGGPRHILCPTEERPEKSVDRCWLLRKRERLRRFIDRTKLPDCVGDLLEKKKKKNLSQPALGERRFMQSMALEVRHPNNTLQALSSSSPPTAVTLHDREPWQSICFSTYIECHYQTGVQRGPRAWLRLLNHLSLTRTDFRKQVTPFRRYTPVTPRNPTTFQCLPPGDRPVSDP